MINSVSYDRTRILSNYHNIIRVLTGVRYGPKKKKVEQVASCEGAASTTRITQRRAVGLLTSASEFEQTTQLSS